MKDLSLYLLDITMNSVRAGAKHIDIKLFESADHVLTMTVSDDGCGMTPEQVARLSDPFYTTRKTRKVGLGVPFLKMLAEMCGGRVEISSVPESCGEDHGTTVTATFRTDHIDFIPLGDVVETVLTLVQGSPDVDFSFEHTAPGLHVSMDTGEMRAVLGEDVPLNSYGVLAFIKEYLTDQYCNKN